MKGKRSRGCKIYEKLATTEGACFAKGPFKLGDIGLVNNIMRANIIKMLAGKFL